jgi:hypothetical protein
LSSLPDGAELYTEYDVRQMGKFLAPDAGYSPVFSGTALVGSATDFGIDIVVVYKVDRLTRSLADFAKLIELFEAHAVSFVS